MHTTVFSATIWHSPPPTPTTSLSGFAMLQQDPYKRLGVWERTVISGSSTKGLLTVNTGHFKCLNKLSFFWWGQSLACIYVFPSACVSVLITKSRWSLDEVPSMTQWGWLEIRTNKFMLDFVSFWAMTSSNEEIWWPGRRHFKHPQTKWTVGVWMRGNALSWSALQQSTSQKQTKKKTIPVELTVDDCSNMQLVGVSECNWCKCMNVRQPVCLYCSSSLWLHATPFL